MAADESEGLFGLLPEKRGSEAVKGGPGHPPADPRVLMALWL